MESKPDVRAMGSEVSSAMIPVDQGEQGKNYDNVTARRLKNRERQRRYRARKRLETGIKGAHNTNNSALPQIQVEVNWALNGGESRILCRRNWKQDARKAYLGKQQQIISNGPLFGSVEGPLVKCENNIDNSVNKDETERRVVRGRRHWKADARNKKD